MHQKQSNYLPTLKEDQLFLVKGTNKVCFMIYRKYYKNMENYVLVCCIPIDRQNYLYCKSVSTSYLQKVSHTPRITHWKYMH